MGMCNGWVFYNNRTLNHNNLSEVEFNCENMTNLEEL